MTHAPAASTLQAAGDGSRSLPARLRRAELRRKTGAFLLVVPLLAFVIVSFIIPIGMLVYQSVSNREVVGGLPRTVAAIATWDGQSMPDETVFAALATDVREGGEATSFQSAARRLNYEIPGYRSLLLTTARNIDAVGSGPYRDALMAIDPRWGDRGYWAAIYRNRSPITDHYYLATFDLRRDAESHVVAAPENQRIYVAVFLRTFWIGLLVTLACLAIGYPVAFLLATQPARISNLLMIMVLLPFWTSLLVRSTAWVVLLQRQGLLNDALVWSGLINERISLIFNRPGLLIAMTHVLLPFMILPLYSVMKGVDASYTRAAISLGATPLRAFLTVYVPQTLPGIGAGCLLVFILAIGYYITPELVGGGGDQMVSHFIAIFTNQIINWGQAAAMAIVLLAAVAILYAVYSRFFGIDRLKLS
jgi:putative spermidine/putrescine transport system permease protein